MLNFSKAPEVTSFCLVASLLHVTLKKKKKKNQQTFNKVPVLRIHLWKLLTLLIQHDQCRQERIQTLCITIQGEKVKMNR